MKAKFIEFNGEWHKDCNNCAKAYASDSIEGLSIFFRRDSKTQDGLSRHCKACRVVNDRTRQQALARKRKWLAKPSSKKIHTAREMVRKTYMKALHRCSVLNCNVIEIEFHHVNYDDPLAVVPLCKKHHMDNHRTCKGLEYQA